MEELKLEQVKEDKTKLNNSPPKTKTKIKQNPVDGLLRGLSE